MPVTFFESSGPLDFAAGERSISAWKTTQREIGGRHYITITEGSDGNELFLGKTFEVISFHHGGGKIIFNSRSPIELSTLLDSIAAPSAS